MTKIWNACFKSIRFNASKIIFDDKYNPLKFTDNILLFADGKTSSEIINTKDFDKYSVNISASGTVYISLLPKKMNISYEEYKKKKESAKWIFILS